MNKSNYLTCMFFDRMYRKLPLLVAMILFLLSGNISSAQSLREKNGFISDRVYSAGELKKIHPVSLWQAIKYLEPSLIEGDENNYGADPNNIPASVEIRGTNRWGLNSLTKAAMPTFIIDGAIVDSRRVYDLNINDVAQVIIRMDAASGSEKGLRAGGGVIEIETVKPEQGTVRLSYSFDGSFQWADLSSYDVLNAKQKLGLEKQAGLYAFDAQLLQERETDVADGVNKNWLKAPLTTAFQHRHRITVDGGDEFVKYKLSLRVAPNAQGVMDGSKRDIYGADAFIEYRYRALVLSNWLSVDKIDAEASPYGSFDYYSLINPYFRTYNANGFINHVLGENSFNEMANPVYEESLGSFHKMESYAIWNNFNAEYSFSAKLKIGGRFSFVRDHAKEDIYISPASYVFSDSDAARISEAGRYDISRRNRTTYEGNTGLYYNDNYGLSEYGASLSMNVFQGKFDRDYYGGTGIPDDRMGFIAFTTTYNPSLKPDALKYYDRMLSGLLSGYYSFDNRYQAYFNLRVDKSSLLAPDKRTALFYGVSGRWNIHNEKFLQDNSIIDKLSLQASLGTTGGIDFSEEDYSVMYSYNIGNEYIHNYYLIGASIQSLANPALKWKTTHNRNISLLTEIKGMKLRINYYNNTTKNLLTIAPEALATGYETSASNGGKIRNSGFEYSLSADILNKSDGLRLNVYTSGIHNKNEIVFVPDFFRDIYNKTVTENYEDYLASGFRPGLIEKGKSVNTIYAVRSLGVDASGKETFQAHDGSTVDECRFEDLVAIGNADPKLNGTFGFNIGWKQWMLNAHFAYSLGGKIYNETLHQIQNSGFAYNGDKRMADDKIRANNAPIPATSRFVEKNNQLGFASLCVGYDFMPEVASKLYMKQLGIFVTGNNLFHVTSADYNRGVYYPFARTLTLSLRATF